MKECDKRKCHISSKLHMIYVYIYLYLFVFIYLCVGFLFGAFFQYTWLLFWALLLASHWALSWTSWLQSTSVHPVSLRSSHLSFGSRTISFNQGFWLKFLYAFFLSCMLPFTLSSLSQFNPKYMLIPHLFNVYDNTHFLYPKNDPGYLFQVFRLKSWSVGISDRRNSCYLPRPSPSVHCTTRWRAQILKLVVMQRSPSSSYVMVVLDVRIFLGTLLSDIRSLCFFPFGWRNKFHVFIK